MGPDTVRYFLKTVTPMVLMALVRESLGTPKLEHVMAEHLTSTADSAQRFIGSFLYADLELPGYIDKLDELEKSAKSKYQRDLVFFKLLSAILLKNLSDGDADRLAQIASNAYGAIAGGSVKLMSDAMKAEFKRKLRKVIGK